MTIIPASSPVIASWSPQLAVAVYFPAVSHTDNKYNEDRILDFVYDAVVADADAVGVGRTDNIGCSGRARFVFHGVNALYDPRLN